MLTINIGQEIELTITSLSHGGSGVGRFNDFVVFVPQTAPEDTILAKVIHLKKNYAEADLIKIIKPSPSRVKPPCPVFGKCGGCQWQHVDYKEQLKQKQAICEHALSRIAHEEDIPIQPIVASPQEWNYRNRAQFRTVGPKAGLYQRGTHELVEFDECLIVDKRINDELNKIKKEIADNPVTKISKTEVCLTKTDQVIRSQNHAHGEEIGFSQVNTLQNENLQKLIVEVLGKPGQVDTDNVGGRGNLLDLYCGNGNFSFPAAELGWRVYGVDNNRRAINIGRSMATQKTFFSVGLAEWEVQKLVERKRQFEMVIIDPPRIGAHDSLWKSLVQLKPKRIVYVSCNPTTFARDWARLKSAGPYKLRSVQPFDMFPQTFHVELIAVADRI